MKRIAIVAALAATVFAACSDDTTTPTPATPDSNIPGGGSVYVYETTDMYTDASGADSNVTATDTMKVSDSKKTVGGKEATEIIVYRGSVATDTTYYYQDGGNLYQYVAIGAEGLFTLPAAWMKVADQTNATWDVATIPVTDLPIPIGPVTAMVSGTVAVKGTKLGAETVTVNGTAISCIKYKNSVSGSLIAKVGSIEAPIPVNFTEEMKYGKGHTMIQSTRPKQVVEIDATITTYKVNIPGRTRVLTSFTVK